MAFRDITFPNRNNSINIGDAVKRSTASTSNGFTMLSSIVQIGLVTAINYTDATGAPITGMRITVDVSPGASVPTSSFYILSKNQQVEKSSLKGYYAIANFANNSTSAAEMFSANANVTVSSK